MMTKHIKSVDLKISNNDFFHENRNQNKITIDNLKRILNDPILKKSYEKYKTKFSIHLDGEPFIRRDLQEIFDVIDERYPHSFKTISTNGLKTKDILKFIKNNQNQDFKINVSVDGLRKVHDEIRGFQGSFRRTIYTLANIKKRFPNQKIEICMTLIPKNYNQILKVYRLSKKLNCSFFFKPAENMENYTIPLSNKRFEFTKEKLCTIRNQCFTISDNMYRNKQYAKAKFYRDIPFYLAGKKKLKGGSIFNKELTIMPEGEAFFCTRENKIGNVLKNNLSDLFEKNNKDQEYSPCMLMCRSFKDYNNSYYEHKTANIETTNRCNLDCDMCTQKNLRKKEYSGDMSLETFRNIIEENKDIHHISFVGGEPFIHSSLFDMMHFLDEKGITYEITTNGFFIDENVVEELKSCIGLKKINFSLDGQEEIHDKIRGKGIFDKCIKGLKLCKDFFNINVCSVLRQDNIEDISELSKYLEDIGIKNMKIIYGMNFEPSKLKEKSLNVQTPNFSNSISYSDSERFKTMRLNMNWRQKKGRLVPRKINIEYEPSLKIFMSLILGNKKNDIRILCNQSDPLRFNKRGKRIMCEMIREEHTNKKVEEISRSRPNMCSKCCKLKNYPMFIKDIIKEEYGIEIKNIKNINFHTSSASYMGYDYKKNNYLIKINLSKEHEVLFNNITYLYKFLEKEGFTLNPLVFTIEGKNVAHKKEYSILMYKFKKGFLSMSGKSKKEDLDNLIKKLANFHNTTRHLFDKIKDSSNYISDKKLSLIGKVSFLQENQVVLIKEIRKKILRYSFSNDAIIHGEWGLHNILKKKRDYLICDFESIGRGNVLYDFSYLLGAFILYEDVNLPYIESYSKFLKEKLSLYYNVSGYKEQKNDIYSVSLLICYYFIKNLFDKLFLFEDKVFSKPPLYKISKTVKYLRMINNLLDKIDNGYDPTKYINKDKSFPYKREFQSHPIYSSSNQKSKQNHHTVDLMIEPTNRCNLRCPTCYSYQEGRKKRDMSFNDFKKIIDNNISMIGNLALYNYGEPLLNKDIFRMVKYAKKRKIPYIKLTSNGMKLDKTKINELLNSGLDYISISLDGATEKTYPKFRVGGDFNTVVKNTKELVKKRNEKNSRLKIELQFIIMSHNEHEVEDIKNLSKKLGADFLRLKKVLIKNQKWKHLLPKNPKYNRYSGDENNNKLICNKPLKELVINSNGNVIPCCYIVGEDINEFMIGNIFEDNIYNMINSDFYKYKRFVKNCMEDKSRNSCCKDCDEGNKALDYKLFDLRKKYQKIRK